MTVETDEPASGYNCPKHGLALEKVEGARVIRKVVVERKAAHE